MTHTAVENFFRTAKGTLPDKLIWKPENRGKTVLQQSQEIAQMPNWFALILERRKMPVFTSEMIEQATQERESLKTLEECEKRCIANSAKLYSVIQDFPDADLDIQIHLPFWRAGVGFDATMADVILFHYWHLVYHQGQVNYVQTLYGDQDMH